MFYRFRISIALALLLSVVLAGASSMPADLLRDGRCCEQEACDRG